jgi:hypothetical protein
MAKRTLSVMALGLLLFVGLVTAGCGGGTTASNSKTINAAQFNTLQKARREIGTMIQECSQALDPALTLAQKQARVSAVLEKHKGQVPDPQSFPMGTGAQRKAAAGRLKGTVEGQLNQLVDNPVGSAAGFVSQMYLRAVGDLYGLQSFEKFVVEHTVAEGAKVNPSNPPAQVEANTQQGFQMLSANITYNPATGDMKYILGEHEPDYMLSNATPAQIENQFVVDSKYWLTQGDSTLLDDAKI